jgi:hypothetical protein
MKSPDARMFRDDFIHALQHNRLAALRTFEQLHSALTDLLRVCEEELDPKRTPEMAAARRALSGQLDAVAEKLAELRDSDPAPGVPR